MNLFTITTVRDFRDAEASGSLEGALDKLVEIFLPMVHGMAGALVPGDPERAEGMVMAVFELFAFQRQKLSKRTVIATWLIQTTWLATRRERQRLGLRAPLNKPSTDANYVLLRALYRLRPKYLSPVGLVFILRENPVSASQALRIKPARLEKYQSSALKKLAQQLRKKGFAPKPSALLESLAQPVTPELETRVREHLHAWSPQQEKGEQVRAIIRSWRRVKFQRGLKRFVRALSVFICLLAALVGTFVWLAQNGYFTAWFIQQGSSQMAREFPEITKPARAWPIAAADEQVVSHAPPKTSAELYGLTNIWLSKFTFSEAQWKKIAPSHISAVPNLMQKDGRIILRNPKARRSGLAGALGVDFNWTESQLEFAGSSFSNVAVRFRGNGTYFSSLYGPKQSFKVDLNKFSKAQKIAGVHTLNFINAIPDNSYLHDGLAEKLFRDLGVPAPRTAYSYLSIDVPQKFTNQALGLYVLIENIDADFAANRFGSKKTPIFKPVTYELFNDLGDDWQAYASIYDLKTKATPQQMQRVIEFAHLVTNADDTEFAKRLPEFLDLNEFAAFVAGHVLLSSYDGFLANGQNYYIYLDPHLNKFGFISWDQDHSWGEFGYVATADQREHASIWKPGSYHNRFLERVMKVDSFRAIYRSQLERAMHQLFTVDRLYPKIDQLAARIRPAVAAESDFRLKRFDQAISSEWLPGPRDGQPEGPKAPVHQIKRFIVNRIQSVRDQLDGKVEGAILTRNSAHK